MKMTSKTADIKNPLLRRIWRRLSSDASWVRHFGDFREKEFCGQIERPNYTYGMLRAADTALFFGHKSVTVCEFGVASGWGLLNMIKVSELIHSETGIKFRIVGFDTGAGLPAVHGYKDHPELWSGGDFAMGDTDALKAKISGKAELILGNINDTINGFVSTLSAGSPLGFVSVDVDIYSGTVAALKVLSGDVNCYLPAISFYLDDVSSYFSNEACGELAAVLEHNESHPIQCIHADRSLPGLRPQRTEGWYRHMYVCHMLEHSARNKPRDRGALHLMEHLNLMGALR
jgi:hypothetical protein